MQNRISRANAANECRVIDVSKAAHEAKAFESPVVITVTHYRYRKIDTDATVIKWAIDGIVKAGILRDDSTDEIKEIRHRFKKVSSKADEKTVIEIEACEG